MHHFTKTGSGQTWGKMCSSRRLTTNSDTCHMLPRATHAHTHMHSNRTKRDAWAGSFEELLLDNPRTSSLRPTCHPIESFNLPPLDLFGSIMTAPFYSEQERTHRCGCRPRRRSPRRGGRHMRTPHRRATRASSLRCVGWRRWTCWRCGHRCLFCDAILY